MSYIPKTWEVVAAFGTLESFLDYVENLFTIASSISMAVEYWVLLMDP